MLCCMKELLQAAEEGNYAIGSFTVPNMECLMGTLRAAEEADTPVIIQIAEGRLKHSPLPMIGSMMVQAAKESPIKVAVHFDHGLTAEMITKAIELGFTSVMYDGSNLPYEEVMIEHIENYDEEEDKKDPVVEDTTESTLRHGEM